MLCDVNRVAVEFVLTDLDLALTFMDIAEVSQTCPFGKAA